MPSSVPTETPAPQCPGAGGCASLPTVKSLASPSTVSRTTMPLLGAVNRYPDSHKNTTTLKAPVYDVLSLTKHAFQTTSWGKPVVRREAVTYVDAPGISEDYLPAIFSSAPGVENSIMFIKHLQTKFVSVIQECSDRLFLNPDMCLPERAFFSEFQQSVDEMGAEVQKIMAGVVKAELLETDEQMLHSEIKLYNYINHYHKILESLVEYAGKGEGGVRRGTNMRLVMNERKKILMREYHRSLEDDIALESEDDDYEGNQPEKIEQDEKDEKDEKDKKDEERKED